MLRYSRSVNRLIIGAYAGLVSGVVRCRRTSSIFMSLSFPLRVHWVSFLPFPPCSIALTATADNEWHWGLRIVSLCHRHVTVVGVLLTSILETPCGTYALDTTEVAHEILVPASSDVGVRVPLAH